MKRSTRIYLLIVLGVALYLNFAYIAHLRQCVADRITYEDVGGCKGHYQGEGYLDGE